MKYMFAVKNSEELEQYKNFIHKHDAALRRFVKILQSEFEVMELPEFVVLSNFEMATKVFRDIPIPAYTNDIRTVITPEISIWRDIYLKQWENYLPSKELESIRRYYAEEMNDTSILQIIAHELVHWSELFLDDFDNAEALKAGIWFEEGMAEYISRKFIYSEYEFETEKEVAKILVRLYEDNNEKKSIETFGTATYEETYDVIFYYYWRSFLAIDELVRKCGDIKTVFEKYHEWDSDGRKMSLSNWFHLE